VHGNGLGLSIVKRIVTAHGGRITVATRRGEGSAFTIQLPAADPAAFPAYTADERTGLGPHGVEAHS
jgi:signal transduction histidine kinase